VGDEILVERAAIGDARGEVIGGAVGHCEDSNVSRVWHTYSRSERRITLDDR
jgi:hypothetical protein